MAFYIPMSPVSSQDSSSGSLHALIYLGASSLSLLIADSSRDFQTVDFLMQPLPLARDIFRNEKVMRPTVERCVQVIDNYKSVLTEYSNGVKEIPLRLVAANILLEANNKDAFLNRIQVANGLNVEPLDDGEMTRLIYMKTQENLTTIPDISKKNVLMVHVGPGNTRALVFEHGRIAGYAGYRLGTHRSGEVLDVSMLDPLNTLDVIREHVRGQLDQIYVDHRSLKIDAVIAIGLEIQTLCPHFRKKGEKKIPLKSLRKFAETMAAQTSEEWIKAYNAGYADADSLLPALVINLSIAESLGLENIYIPDKMYESSIMRDMLVINSRQQRDLEDEVLRFANSLADRYQTDRKHRHHVMVLADSLFDQLQSLHGLNSHDKLLLEVASILHEIGTYVSARQHHKHARYIISNTDIFGLNTRDVDIVALLLNYHRQETPDAEHDETYRNLTSEQRVRVSKQAALLRIAVALDRSHSQRIKSVTAVCRGHRLDLTAHGVLDTTVEEIALQGKADLFEEIFGLDVRITPGI